MNALLPVARITDDEFDRMIEKGAAEILGRIELREGALHRMNAEYVPHAWVKSELFKALSAAVEAAGLPLHVMTECTVRFGDGFSPLPDLIVWTPAAVQGQLPGSAVKLIVEVADTTLADDLGAKRAAYAKAGLTEYWVVDVNTRALHRFSQPKGEDFTETAIFREGEEVAAATLKGVGLTLAFPV